MSKWQFTLVITSLLLAGLLMHLHNVRLFNPLYGFDGQGHIDYLEYIKQYHRVPLTHEGWQMYQPPLYYLLAYPLFRIGGIALAQYLNIFWYGMLVILGGYLIARLLDRSRSAWLVGSLCLAALPVTNYLIPMISNEYMNDVLVCLALLLIAALPLQHKSYRSVNLLIILLCLVLGFYTKYTILTLGITYVLALGLSYSEEYNGWLKMGAALSLSVAFCLVASLPLTLRNIEHYRTPLPLAEQFFPFRGESSPRNWQYFTNMSWVYPPDLFHAQYYSFSGGTWNTFWHDGYQAVVPVVAFHKKAFLLSLLGFILAPWSVYGYVLLWRSSRKIAALLLSYVMVAWAAYILYNLHLPYPSELKAFFMSGLPVVYGVGITAVTVYRPRLRRVTLTLLTIQMLVMIS